MDNDYSYKLQVINDALVRFIYRGMVHAPLPNGKFLSEKNAVKNNG